MGGTTVNASIQLFQGYPLVACELLAMMLPSSASFLPSVGESFTTQDMQVEGRQARA
jgi:hypothetical protein